MGYYTLLMGLEGTGKYQIQAGDARIIKIYQLCKAMHWDLTTYRDNPAWWNEACFALICTENKAQTDKIEENYGRAGT